jgi:hypothetical protein
MVEKPAYCIHCRYAFEYDTDRAKAGRFRYILVCPKCGKENRVLKAEYGILLESTGILLGAFLGFYFLLRSPFYDSIIWALAMALVNMLVMYYIRVVRFKRSTNSL